MIIKAVGILLAGGQSKRFGSPKMFAKRKGIPFYKYSLNVLEAIVDETYIVTQSNYVQKFVNLGENIKVITDLPKFQSQGPLAGLLSVMITEHAEWYVVLPTDVPFIEQSIIIDLLELTEDHIQAVIPIENGQEHPLIGVYHKSVKKEIYNLLEEGHRSVSTLLNQITVKEYKVFNDMPFLNINHQSDYQNYIENEK